LFLVDRAGEAPRLKVLDFGISKMSSPADGDLSLTEASTTLGSPAYMSPEQVRLAKSVDHRADIWSLGVVLHRLVTGKQPFVGDGFSAICAAVATDAPPRLREDRPDAPMGLERVVLRCLEKDPARRYPTIAELAAALVPFATPRGQSAAAKMIKPVAAAADVRAEPAPMSEAPPSSDEMGAETGSPAVVGAHAAPAGRAFGWRSAIAIVAALAAILALALVAAPRASSSPVAPPMTAVAAQPRADVVTPPTVPSVGSAGGVTTASSITPVASSRTPPPGSRRASPPAPTPAVSSVAPVAPSHDPPPPFGGKALQSRE
jgi:serine/threonine-protein kinase